MLYHLKFVGDVGPRQLNNTQSKVILVDCGIFFDMYWSIIQISLQKTKELVCFATSVVDMRLPRQSVM